MRGSDNPLLGVGIVAPRGVEDSGAPGEAAPVRSEWLHSSFVILRIAHHLFLKKDRCCPRGVRIEQSRSGSHATNLFRVPIIRSEEHTSELQSLMRISYAVFCLKKKKPLHTTTHNATHPTHPTQHHLPLTT